MTILIVFHQSGYRPFKAYYLEQVLKHWRTEFPGWVSYSRFIEFVFVPLTAIPLMAYLHCLFGDGNAEAVSRASAR